MTKRLRPILALAFAAIGVSSIASAHYHFIHFTGRSAPWQALPEKFDLNSLPNRTLTYFVTDQTGIQLAPNDSYVGLISEIRAAAKVWNDVETSDLRVAFGGFAAPKTPQSAPSMEIIFEEMAPGIVAFGGPEIKGDSNGQFIPILKSVVAIGPDLRNRPSFGEKFVGTLVHEIGHALGLQHTFTSGVMATAFTRSTSRSKPLTTDDIAGISLLYPAKSLAQTTGSISGRVTLSGAGANLASVVAISASGVVVSTLTNPDGTYRIEGLPPRQYFVYVHPLPPAQQGQASPGDIVFPLDADGRALGPSVPFFTIFYAGNAGTNDPSAAWTIKVDAGITSDGVDFAVRPRTGYGIHSVDTYAFPGRTAVKPAYLSPSIAQPFLVASGSGLVSASGLAPGLTVRVLGGATLAVRPYSPAPSSYVQMDFDVRTLSVSSESARHLVFSQNNDIYVLPAAFFQVDKLPPSISSILAVQDGSQRLAVINGNNLSEASQVFFDGVPATVREFDALGSRLTVVPPVAPANHRASVVILNPDGQSSLFIDGDVPPTYTYNGDSNSLASAPQNVTVSPNALPAGTEAVLQIETPAGSFVDGQTVVGFGNSDVVVRQTYVATPSRLLVSVSINPTAQPSFAHLSIASGLHLLTQQFALQVTPPARTFWLSSNVTNALTGLPSISAGSQAVMRVGASPVALNANNVTLLWNDRSIPILGVDNNQVTFQIPAGTPVGGAIVRLEAGGERSLPALLIVDPPPPRILSAITDSGERLSTVKVGQLIALTIADLDEEGATVETSRIEVTLAGVHARVAQVLEQPDAHKVLVYVPEMAPSAEIPLSVSVDDRTSDPITVSVEN